MISQEFKEMISAPSVIRALSVYATERGKEIGYENVFDYSLGNPSVPVPKELTEAMIELLQTKDSTYLHGYSPN
ncbi:MAG: pyridoxal phosphate-dependent aminotransferase, partial [Lachnospiraceae bacterium]|nr:pyridoxal phosphate-dependent aminotransferase [Lachnospiraceae bacterium]